MPLREYPADRRFPSRRAAPDGVGTGAGRDRRPGGAVGKGVETDAGLISRVAAGEPDALAALYNRHAKTVYSLAYNMMRGREAAEDLVQDAFLEVWQKAAGYREERGAALTWILTIVHNRGVDRLRALGARRRAQERLAGFVPASEPADAFVRTWEGLLRERVNGALRLLPPEQLEVIELVYFSGYTHREVSGMLGVPLGTVKGRMRLGLKKLRRHFEKNGMA